MEKMPVLFLAHGSPMNAVEKNPYTDMLEGLSKTLKKPKAILCISAHWKTRGTFITLSDTPKTIHDFYGFPKELYEVRYSPIGAKIYAERTVELLREAGEEVYGTEEWGLDHGTWSVLKHVYPKADVPVFQMSLNGLLDDNGHYEIAKKLSKLRQEGILIVGSGNIVHNLEKISFEELAAPYKWAETFDRNIGKFLTEKNHKGLVEYKKLKDQALALPTDEHFLPVLYAAALQEDGESVKFLYEGIYNSSLSMRAFAIS